MLLASHVANKRALAYFCVVVRMLFILWWMTNEELACCVFWGQRACVMLCGVMCRFCFFPSPSPFPSPPLLPLLSELFILHGLRPCALRA